MTIADIEAKARDRQEALTAISEREARHKAYCEADLRLARYGAFFDLANRTSPEIAREMKPDLAAAVDEIEAAVRELNEDRGPLAQAAQEAHSALLAEVGTFAARTALEGRSENQNLLPADLIMKAIEGARELRLRYVDKGDVRFEASGPLTQAVCREVASAMGVSTRKLRSARDLETWFREPIYGVIGRIAAEGAGAWPTLGVNYAPDMQDGSLTLFKITDPTCIGEFRAGIAAAGAEVVEAGVRDPHYRRGKLQEVVYDADDLHDAELSGELLHLRFLRMTTRSPAAVIGALQAVEAEIERRASAPAP